MTRVYSWNINGLRAIVQKGFLDWLAQEKPDILCLQETKAFPEDVGDEILAPHGYRSVWHPAKKKGYSGVVTYHKVRRKPISVRDLGVGDFDDEGRGQILEYEDFFVVNTYWPNSQPERKRLPYKLDFVKTMTEICTGLAKTKGVILCGDYNIAHKEIDLARPKANRDNPGFYPEECASMDAFIGAGFVDTFRHFCQEPDHYSWWSYRANARAKNIGWRLDYHCVNRGFIDRVKNATIHSAVLGSDHCPVSVTVK